MSHVESELNRISERLNNLENDLANDLITPKVGGRCSDIMRYDDQGAPIWSSDDEDDTREESTNNTPRTSPPSVGWMLMMKTIRTMVSTTEFVRTNQKDYNLIELCFSSFTQFAIR